MLFYLVYLHAIPYQTLVRYSEYTAAIVVGILLGQCEYIGM